MVLVASTAVVGMVLTPAVAFAAARNSAVPLATPGQKATHSDHARHAHSSQVPTKGTTQASENPSTTVTFSVTTGELTMTAPTDVSLGSGLPGSTVSGSPGTPVTVTDDRALLAPTWTVVAAQSDFTNTEFATAAVIPAADETYDPGTITATDIIATGSVTSMTTGDQPVVTAATGSGDNTASWTPTLSVAIPGTAVGGPYTGTLTQSVS